MVIWQFLVLTAWMAEKLSAFLYISYWNWSQCYQRCVSFSAVKVASKSLGACFSQLESIWKSCPRNRIVQSVIFVGWWVDLQNKILHGLLSLCSNSASFRAQPLFCLFVNHLKQDGFKFVPWMEIINLALGKADQTVNCYQPQPVCQTKGSDLTGWLQRHRL